MTPLVLGCRGESGGDLHQQAWLAVYHVHATACSATHAVLHAAAVAVDALDSESRSPSQDTSGTETATTESAARRWGRHLEAGQRDGAVDALRRHVAVENLRWLIVRDRHRLARDQE